VTHEEQAGRGALQARVNLAEIIGEVEAEPTGAASATALHRGRSHTAAAAATLILPRVSTPTTELNSLKGGDIGGHARVPATLCVAGSARLKGNSARRDTGGAGESVGTIAATVLFSETTTGAATARLTSMTT